jgi:glutathione S-transferase
VAKPLLVVGTKYKSSWSLRPWIALKVAGVDFDEKVVVLDTPEFRRELKRYPDASARVPILVDGDITIWESLAICEYAAETWAPSLWPKDKAPRALARSVSNEMHAGFAALRNACSMNLKADLRGTTLSPEAGADAHRVLTIWRTCRERYGKKTGKPFLFGDFTIADAMYAPVVTRFVTYGIPADAVGQEYMDAIQALPAFVEWKAAALAEPA